MPVPNTFGTATSAIPLSQLDANFNTPITLGNTAIQLGDTVTTLNNMTLANVTISSGTITITNVAVTTANVSGTANVSTLVVVGNETVGGNTTITGNITAANANVTSNLVLSGGTANGVAYLNGSKVLTTGSALTYSGTTFVNSTNSNAGNFIVNRNISAGAAATSYVISDASAAFTAFTAFGSRSSGYTTSGMLQPSSGGMFTVGMTNGLNIMTLDAYPVNFGTQNVLNMTLDTSGNLGIGTSSPATKTEISGASGLSTGSGTTIALRISDTSSDGGAGTWNTTQQFSAVQFFSADTSGAGTAVRASVGATMETGSGSASALTFFTNNGTNTERMRLDSSGNLLVGATSQNASCIHVLQSASTTLFSAGTVNTSATPRGHYIQFSSAAPNGTGNEFIFAGDNAATRFTVRSNGGIANYSANNVNLSDRREKTNFAPAGLYLDKICAIPVQTFNYIDQNIEDDAGLTLGVVAQDVQAVAPELVMESNWGTEEEPKMRLSIYQTDLQYALMKCIQEQQALITQLTARITALEGA